MNITFVNREQLEDEVKKKIKNVDSVLDIGCGIRPQSFINPIIHICAEPFEQYVERLLEIKNGQPKRIDHNLLLIKLTWDDVIKSFPVNSVDSIFILDVIEHLEKEDGKRLLKQTEEIAKNQIIIFTPLGFLPQKDEGKDAWGMDGLDWQEHRSGWTPEDFDDSWDIYISKEYHLTNNKGVEHSKPYGAFYAIKTKKTKEESLDQIIKKIMVISNELIYKTIIFIHDNMLLVKKIFKKLGRVVFKKHV